jgi:tripartite ATP-independent transporter DctM subunit
MGVVIPPSILMIVWGGLMSVSIGGLFMAGVVPGILIALSMMVTVFVYASRRNYPIQQRASLNDFLQASGQALLALITPAIVVGGIVLGFFTPTEASVVAVIYSAILGVLVYRSIGLRSFPVVLYDSARLAAISLFCIGTASTFGWLLAWYRIPYALVELMSGWGAGPAATGCLVALAFLFVGMFIDAIPAIIILGTVLLPLAARAGIHPIHFAMIGVISLAIGLVTPPYGLCLLISCSLGDIKVVNVLKDVAVILLPMLLLLLVVVFFADVVLFLPRLLTPQFL